MGSVVDLNKPVGKLESNEMEAPTPVLAFVSPNLILGDGLVNDAGMLDTIFFTPLLLASAELLSLDDPIKAGLSLVQQTHLSLSPSLLTRQVEQVHLASPVPPPPPPSAAA